MILLEFYVWTVFFSFLFYTMINLSNADKEVELIVRYKGNEINPIIAFLLPIVNLIVMVYEVALMVEIVKKWGR